MTDPGSSTERQQSRLRAADCAGAILAGGRGRRMGGVQKALEPLAGRPLLQHVIDRLEPQVAMLALSVERFDDTLSSFGIEQIPDPEPGSRGPLGGLLAALGHAADMGYEWLVLAPCDAPFLPPELAVRLRDCARSQRARAVAVAHRGHLHPVFSLWHRTVLTELDKAVRGQGLGGFKAFLRSQPHAVLDWADDGGDPFFNINDRAALRRAAALAAEHPGDRT
jgi:molybdopterin-guanine dinucleotide biosynthesis protein A